MSGIVRIDRSPLSVGLILKRLYVSYYCEVLSVKVGFLSVFKGALKLLTPREEKILLSLWGWEKGVRMSLREVGVEHDVTKERIRQIKEKAYRKLKHPSISKKFREYIVFKHPY